METYNHTGIVSSPPSVDNPPMLRRRWKQLDVSNESSMLFPVDNPPMLRRRWKPSMSGVLLSCGKRRQSPDAQASMETCGHGGAPFKSVGRQSPDAQASMETPANCSMVVMMTCRQSPDAQASMETPANCSMVVMMTCRQSPDAQASMETSL